MGWSVGSLNSATLGHRQKRRRTGAIVDAKCEPWGSTGNGPTENVAEDPVAARIASR